MHWNVMILWWANVKSQKYDDCLFVVVNIPWSMCGRADSSLKWMDKSAWMWVSRCVFVTPQKPQTLTILWEREITLSSLTVCVFRLIRTKFLIAWWIWNIDMAVQFFQWVFFLSTYREIFKWVSSIFHLCIEIYQLYRFF